MTPRRRKPDQASKYPMITAVGANLALTLVFSLFLAFGIQNDDSIEILIGAAGIVLTMIAVTEAVLAYKLETQLRLRITGERARVRYLEAELARIQRLTATGAGE